jgi:hypothetical protein
MNAQARQLIDELFDRLSKLETAPRDADAEAAMMRGLRRAPNAAYALVQTVLLQDEALKRANARLEELEGGAVPPSSSGSFLDTMREGLFRSQQSRGSVPSVRPQGSSRPVWNSGQVNAQLDQRYPPAPGFAPGHGSPYGASPSYGGSSFLGTAAAAAAGMVGGSLLMSGIRGLMGSHQAFADPSVFGGDNRTPWSDQSDSSLARDAGIDDIGRAGHSGDDTSRQGFFDQASRDERTNDSRDSDNGDYNDDGFDSGDNGVA